LQEAVQRRADVGGLRNAACGRNENSRRYEWSA
jgi:hypothetical protein